MLQHDARRSSIADTGERGFTLVELMITVAIIAVLSLLAGVGYARWIRTSKTGEATAMLSAIKGAEETYRAETFKYLDVSAQCASGTCTGFSGNWYFPDSAPSDQKVAWNTSTCTGNNPCGNFKTLNISADNTSAGVYFRYGVAAGAPIPGGNDFDGRKYPALNDPWYVIKAIGDLDNNGVQSNYWTSSVDSTVWSVRPDE